MKHRNLFVRPREKKSRSTFSPTSVKCFGCERAKGGGAPCWDHRKSPVQFIWQPQKRWCVRCRKEEASHSDGLCFTCVTKDLSQQQAFMNQLLQGSISATFHAHPTLHAHPSFWSLHEQSDREAIAKTEAELVAGPILAFRTWKICQRGSLYWLEPAGAGSRAWVPKEPMTGDVTIHGVYAWKDASSAVCDVGGRNDYAKGGVWLWGDVIEHEMGYRASHGYPAFLWKRPKNGGHRIEHRPDMHLYTCSLCGKRVDERAVANYPGAIDPLAVLMGLPCAVAQQDQTVNLLAERYEIPVVEVESFESLIVPDKETLLFENSDE